jgi:hypothetical protein
VNFDAKTERDMIHDYKVPSDVFNKLQISKVLALALPFSLGLAIFPLIHGLLMIYCCSFHV